MSSGREVSPRGPLVRAACVDRCSSPGVLGGWGETQVHAARLEDLNANRLLGVLSEADRRRLFPQMYVFDLAAGEALQRAGDRVEHSWFPLGASLASFCVQLGADEQIEVAIVGREGAVGGMVSNGGVPAFATAHVRAPGRFLRIKITALEQAKIDSVHLRYWFARYSDCLLAQVFQTAACNVKHTVLQRACKWLLATSERTESSEIEMTQEELAQLLGVGRPFVNKILGELRAEGCIETRRSRITILDRRKLLRASCGCTTAIESHFDTVLHGIYV
ncbi:MAG: Crp/Fnr family transcriptional regulator [Alphaproteobacteria bacterium]|nr:Crp/Fnr family transcriptional regulator [Alphaproteobacteria bacterium]